MESADDEYFFECIEHDLDDQLEDSKHVISAKSSKKDDQSVWMHHDFANGIINCDEHFHRDRLTRSRSQQAHPAAAADKLERSDDSDANKHVFNLFSKEVSDPDANSNR
uniref:Uncharacterized protein n=1 Tax=Euplotes harpa TaxID=151035 RepID=A0A7S3N2A5_9SPIT|mmetsp:Transcript_12886/g.14746  ORF Transcript_12886/g.14746 Transcript_12886/m.14746 type:complete len:109 (+) Transcript_12886:12-338(+)